MLYALAPLVAYLGRLVTVCQEHKMLRPCKKLQIMSTSEHNGYVTQKLITILTLHCRERYAIATPHQGALSRQKGVNNPVRDGNKTLPTSNLHSDKPVRNRKVLRHVIERVN